MTLKILPEIEENLFPLKPEELNLLEESILSEGVRDALVVWPKDGELILVDGHNRYRIAKDHNIPFEIKEKKFDSIDEVKVWVINNQLGRRNLPDYIKFELIQKKKEILLEIGKKTQGMRTDLLSPSDKKLEEPHDTRKLIAKDLGWSTGKVAMAEMVYKKGPEELKEKLRKGEVSIKQAYKRISKQAQKEKILNKRLADVDNFKDNDKVRLILGDFREANIEDESVDLILTDPPYGIEFENLWEDLGKFAQRVLKPSRFLVSYFGHLNLIDYYNILNRYLKYYWTFCLVHSGNKQLIHPRNVRCGWKPIVVFQKEPFEMIIDAVDDIIEGSGREKELHEWQQGMEELFPLIKAFSFENELVLDPFMGSGTVVMASLSENRRAIGIEIDEKYYQIAGERIFDDKNNCGILRKRTKQVC
ncbi:MAG: DNA modification methylase [Bacillota bacterium]